MDLMCGGTRKDECTAEKWFKFLGTYSRKSKVPFNIKVNMTNYVKGKVMTEEIYGCHEPSDMSTTRCACQDCYASCEKEEPYPNLELVSSWHKILVIIFCLGRLQDGIYGLRNCNDHASFWLHLLDNHVHCCGSLRAETVDRRRRDRRVASIHILHASDTRSWLCSLQQQSGADSSHFNSRLLASFVHPLFGGKSLFLLQ
jgi:hypothetical protein